MGVFQMTSDNTLQNQNIMEILHERYVLIQTAFQQAWEEQSNLIISQTEWKIIGRLEQGELPVAQITKNLHITRQAIHKLIKNLSSKKLIEVHPMKNNKKERCIALSTLGKECYTLYTNIHTEIESKIAMNLGTKQTEDLKWMLQSNWGM